MDLKSRKIGLGIEKYPVVVGLQAMWEKWMKA